MSTFVTGLQRSLQAHYRVELHLIAPDRFRAGPGQRGAQLRLAVEQVIQLLRLRPDVVHTHEHPALLGAAVAYRLLAGPRVRLVHTIHVDPPARRGVWKRRLLGWLLARCSVVTAVSKDTAARLGNVAWPVPVGVRVIYGAGDVPLRQRIDPEVKAFGRANALLDGRVVAQVGPMNFALKVAGFLQLLEAAAIVRQTCPDVRLLLIGHGRLRGQVHDAIARLGLNDAVTVTGYLDDVSVALALTDVYCQITFQDACPLSLLEAMYAARPAVASRTGGIPELITDEVDGLLVDNDPRQIAAAIVRLLERPEEAAQLGQRAASTARARFTWDYVADEFAVAYGLAPRANVSTERSRA